MKVLVAARLFSGMVESVNSGRWPPSGVPAIYKLLEKLHTDPDIELLTVLTVKDPLGSWGETARTVNLDAVGTIKILPWVGRRSLSRFKLAGIVREVDQLIRFLWLVLRFRPDVCYATNANFPMAALCARLGLAPVIMRFLGIHPVQKTLADKAAGIQWYLYQSGFAKAICSMDGSGGSQYLPKLLHPKVPLTRILNGVDPIPPASERVEALKAKHALGTVPLILFVGRLEQNKGIMEFVSAMNRLALLKPGSFDALVIGDGSLREAAQANSTGDTLQFIGPVPHADVAAFMDLANIYVSLNRFGSLSNANLEAAGAGLCLITLEPDPTDATDVESLEVFPEESVIRLPRTGTSESLVATLSDLLENPAEVNCYAQKSRAIAKLKFRSWDDRIALEIDEIKSVAHNTARS